MMKMYVQELFFPCISFQIEIFFRGCSKGRFGAKFLFMHFAGLIIGYLVARMFIFQN